MRIADRFYPSALLLENSRVLYDDAHSMHAIPIASLKSSMCSYLKSNQSPSRATT